jgi:DNA-binding Lrp family transcriptional regulator
MRGLEQSGVIQKRPMTDVHAIGLTQFSIFCTPYFDSAQSQRRLLKQLIESPVTSDIFELGGDYRYGIVLTVCDIQDVYGFLTQLSRAKGVTISQKSLSTRISTSLFQRGYLYTNAATKQHITYRRSDRRIALDTVDSNLLTAMHQHPNATLRELAPLVNLTHTAVASRIKKLESQGIIIGYVYGIASQAFGMEAYRLLVHTKGFDYELWQKVFSFCAQHPHIVCLFQCIGSWDYEFEVEVEDRQQIANIAQEIHEFLGPSVISITTLPIFSFPKSTGYPYSKKFSETQIGGYAQ